MVRNNKLIVGLLAIAISVSAINSKAASAAENESSNEIKINSQSNYTTFGYIPDVKEGTDNKGVDEFGTTWRYVELQDGTLYLYGTYQVTSELKIPSQLNGRTVTAIGRLIETDRRTYDGSNGALVTSVKIPSTVTTLNKGAFDYCTNVTNIELPSSVKNMTAFSLSTTLWFEKQRNSAGYVILNGVLLDAKNVSGDITIPSNVTAIADNAFAYSDEALENLTSVKFPSSVLSVGDGAFKGCSKLKQVEFSNNLTQVDGDAFSECNNLKEVKVPNGETSIISSFGQSVTITRTGTASNNNSNGNNSNSNTTPAQKKQGWYLDGGNWYWFLDDGSKKTGWLLDRGTWYYLYNDGKMAHDTIVEGYYVDSNGAWVKPGWKLIGNNWYWVLNDGSFKSGWLLDRGTWYYLYENGIMAHDAIIDGYRVNSNGAWVN